MVGVRPPERRPRRITARQANAGNPPSFLESTF